MISFILLISLVACGPKKPKNATLVVPTWTYQSYESCEPRLAEGLESLPFDIATTLNRTDMSRFDAWSSSRAWLITHDLKTVNLSLDLLSDEKQGQIGVQVNGASNGKIYLNQMWTEPQHAMIEEVTGSFIFHPGKHRYDVIEKDLSTMDSRNLTQNSPSYYNLGPVMNPANSNEIFLNIMIGNEARPYRMNLNDSVIRPFASNSGFAYGLNISPNGKKYAFHSDYKIVIGDFETGRETRISTQCEFNFGPKWSPDSSKIAFICEKDYFVANADGSGVRFLGSRKGFSGTVPFMKGHDHHGGNTDRYEWMPDSSGLIHAQMIKGSAELVISNLDGSIEQLTNSPNGSRNVLPILSDDGEWVIYHSNRGAGKKMNDLFILNLSSKEEIQVTDLDDDCNSRHAYGISSK